MVDGNSKAVLITSVSSKVPLIKCVKRAIEKLEQPVKIIGADANPNAIGQFFTDDFWVMPRLDKLAFEELLAFCLDRRVAWIVPSRDGELPFFAKHKQALQSNGIHVMVSEPKAVEICLDKLTFYSFGVEKGFPVIATSLSIDGVSGSSYVVKERFGSGSRLVGLDLDDSNARKHALQLAHPVYQPYIEGTEVSVDVYISRSGACKGAVVRTRDVVVDGESKISTTVHHEPLELACVRFAEQLGLYGHALFQAILDHEGNFQFVECNCRVGGASHLSIRAGLDSLYWFFLESSNVDLACVPFVRHEGQLKLVRYANDLIL